MVAVAGWVKFFRPRLPMIANGIRLGPEFDTVIHWIFSSQKQLGCWGKQKSSQLPFFSEPVLLFSRRLLSHMGWPVRFPWINRAIVQWKCGGATFKPSEPLGRVDSIVLPKAGWTVARWEITGRRSSFAFLVGWITWIEQIAEFPWIQIKLHRCIHLWLV